MLENYHFQNKVNEKHYTQYTLHNKRNGNDLN